MSAEWLCLLSCVLLSACLTWAVGKRAHVWHQIARAGRRARMNPRGAVERHLRTDGALDEFCGVAASLLVMAVVGRLSDPQQSKSGR
jgi:hypothetical protein